MTFFIKIYAYAALKGCNRPFGRDHIIIGAAPHFLTKSLGLPMGAPIRLSAKTMISHKHHREATAMVYAKISRQMLTIGLWIKRRSDYRISAYCCTADNKIWEMGIKCSKKGEIYITTLHRCESRKLEKAQKCEVILNE